MLNYPRWRLLGVLVCAFAPAGGAGVALASEVVASGCATAHDAPAMRHRASLLGTHSIRSAFGPALWPVVDVPSLALGPGPLDLALSLVVGASGTAAVAAPGLEVEAADRDRWELPKRYRIAGPLHGVVEALLDRATPSVPAGGARLYARYDAGAHRISITSSPDLFVTVGDPDGRVLAAATLRGLGLDVSQGPRADVLHVRATALERARAERVLAGFVALPGALPFPAVVLDVWQWAPGTLAGVDPWWERAARYAAARGRAPDGSRGLVLSPGTARLFVAQWPGRLVAAAPLRVVVPAGLAVRVPAGRCARGADFAARGFRIAVPSLDAAPDGRLESTLEWRQLGRDEHLPGLSMAARPSYWWVGEHPGRGGPIHVWARVRWVIADPSPRGEEAS